MVEVFEWTIQSIRNVNVIVPKSYDDGITQSTFCLNKTLVISILNSLLDSILQILSGRMTALVKEP